MYICECGWLIENHQEGGLGDEQNGKAHFSFLLYTSILPEFIAMFLFYKIIRYYPSHLYAKRFGWTVLFIWVARQTHIDKLT